MKEKEPEKSKKYQVKEGKALSLKETATAPYAGAVIQNLEHGFSAHDLNSLQKDLEVPIDELAPRLGISKATWHRRTSQGGRLNIDESDRLYRFQRLYRMALMVLESKEDALRWLKSPQPGLGGQVPLEYARTEVGAREVEYLLGRIEHGIYT
jgi:putative toxin-antitoxin system antitoxin component (TIGR02293 family)